MARNPDGTWIAEVDAEGRSTGKPMTFQCKTVPHIELRSIARNISLDPIFAKHGPILAEKLVALNSELGDVGDDLKVALVEKLIAKHKQEGIECRHRCRYSSLGLARIRIPVGSRLFRPADSLKAVTIAAGGTIPGARFRRGSGRNGRCRSTQTRTGRSPCVKH